MLGKSEVEVVSNQESDETEPNLTCFAIFILCLGDREPAKDLRQGSLTYLCFLKNPKAAGAMNE